MKMENVFTLESPRAEEYCLRERINEFTNYELRITDYELRKCRSFILPIHAVEVLHGDAAGAAHEVVFTSENHLSIAHDANR